MNVLLTGLLTFNGLMAKTSPNFILVLTEDQGWSSLSSSMDLRRPESKSDYHNTPNMDALLERGMRFSNGYAAAPVCSPTRYSVQFGKSPARLKYTRVLGDNRADHDQVAIPQILKAVNPDYICAHLGKWHIDAHPDRYSYDLHDGLTTNREGNFTMRDHHREWGGYAEMDPKRVNSITKRAIDFISSSIKADRPFFIQLSHYAVHSDIVYSQATYDTVGKREPGEIHKNHAYAAMIEDLDRSIGTLLKAYDSMGLADNTYLIFTSDNGGMPCLPIQVNKGQPYKTGLNSPLLRGKWDLTEGGIR
ncbi:MAG: sulfatase-like hydrolase/transferase, partial [Verrucomicrobiota bacterium]|nr:sulfatase-like hydrolase/transferase [Verrucomicrobiota bacterium]